MYGFTVTYRALDFIDNTLREQRLVWRRLQYALHVESEGRHRAGRVSGGNKRPPCYAVYETATVAREARKQFQLTGIFPATPFRIKAVTAMPRVSPA